MGACIGKVMFANLDMKMLGAGKKCDVILLDVSMPEFSGLEVLAECRALEKEFGLKKKDRAKIIMQSAYASDYVLHAAKENKCDSFLPKPYEVKDVLTHIRDLNVGMGGMMI